MRASISHDDDDDDTVEKFVDDDDENINVYGMLIHKASGSSTCMCVLFVLCVLKKADAQTGAKRASGVYVCDS